MPANELCIYMIIMIRKIMCALLLTGAVFTSCTTDKCCAPKKEIGIQLYSIRDTIHRAGYQLDSIFKGLAEMGYTSFEAANYSNGKFYGKTPEEFKATAEKYGLTPISSHCNRNLTAEELAAGDFTEGLKWWEQAIADHKAAGMKYIVNPWQNRPGTLAELKTICDYFNEIGKMCNAAGIKYGYHNHSHEMVNVEDRVMLEYMIENTAPENVFYELDVYWTVMGKKSPVEFFEKYPGRFTMLHIKDHREVGQSGMVGFDAIFKNAEKAGVKDIIVEIEGCKGTTMDGAKVSIDYLLNSEFVPASYGK